MDIFDIHNVKVEKANAMLHYRRFLIIAKLFRIIELFLAVVFFSWISIRLPFVIRMFSDYFRRFLSVIVNPFFIFLVGNVIILILVVKSGQITENPNDEEIADNNIREEDVSSVIEPIEPPEEIVYQDKRIVSEEYIKPVTDYYRNENKIEVRQVTNKLPNSRNSNNSVSDLDPKKKIYRRSQSENLMKNECFPVPEKLKRSETEIGRRRVDIPVTEEDVNDVVDELSNEEFQKRIDRFIARQIRFHYEEKLAIVAHS